MYRDQFNIFFIFRTIPDTVLGLGFSVCYLLLSFHSKFRSGGVHSSYFTKLLRNPTQLDKLFLTISKWQRIEANCWRISQGWGQSFKKKNSNLCGDTADFTPPPPYLGQDFMQSPVIDMWPSEVLHWCPKKNPVLTTAIHENQWFFFNVAWAFTPWMQPWRDF